MDEPWPTTPEAAVHVQRRLAPQVTVADDHGLIRTVAGVDLGYHDGLARAAVAVLALPSLEVLESAVAEIPVQFPYVPGFLSFREVPAALEALAHLRQPPDALICDGQGLAHPRRFGLACHLGLAAGLPSVGCAKSRLAGTHDPVPETPGAMVPLWIGSQQVGVVLRSRARARPLYISPGHRFSIAGALALVQACLRGYRLPETTRAAHALASRT